MAVTVLLLTLVAAQAAPLNIDDPRVKATSERLLIELAIDEGSRRAPEPIPLRDDGSMAGGFAYGRFEIVQALAHAAARRGRTPAAEDFLGRERDLPLTIVAAPLTDGNDTLLPTGIHIVDKDGRQLAADHTASGAALAERIPGAPAVPEGLAATFERERLSSGDIVRITYAGRQSGRRTVVDAPVAVTPLRKTHHVTPEYPGSALVGRLEGTVVLAVALDGEGTVRAARAVRGPEDLFEAAIAAVTQWRFAPVRMNGAPVATVLTTVVTFSM